MYKRTERRWKLENALRKAIDRNELALAYQPQICPQSAKIFGAEALLRWTRQEGPIITPTEFIPLAERSDLILEIGEWVLRRACEDAMNWRRLDPDSADATKISVNLSARQLLQPEFAEVVRKVVTETGLDPQTLELELTESILIDSLEKAPAVLREIARQGITLAIDDFGTGYCAISYLRKLTANVIKLDRSFVTDVDRDHRADAIAKGMIGLAHDLGLSVIAEGVEDRQQLSFFQRHRCDLVQGYFTGHPVPAERFQSLLCQNRARVSPDPATSEINSREAERQVLVVQ